MCESREERPKYYARAPLPQYTRSARFRDRRGVVVQAVVDDDQFEVVDRLRAQRLQRIGEETRAVADREEHRHRR
jgi:hypothetical protein